MQDRHDLQPGGAHRRVFLQMLLAGCCLPATAWAAAAELLQFDSIYQSNGIRGLKFAERTTGLRGKPVRLRGFMAPPLKPESKFFVLTRQPVAICPFCSSDAEWPVDIVVIYLKDTLAPLHFTEKVEVEGRLELGSWTDPQTGFVSQMRIVDAVVRKS